MHLSVEPEATSVATRNRHYERDIRYVTKTCRWILGSIGIWPDTFKGFERFFPSVAITVGNLVLCFAIIPCALHIAYEEKDTTIKLKLFGPLSFCVTAAIKYCALAIRRPEVVHCVEHVKNDWKLVELREDREIMLSYGKVGRNLTLTCVSFMYGGGLVYYTILQLATGITVDEYNRTIKPLVYPTYSALYNVHKSPVYELVYAAHCMCGYVMYSVTTGTCGIAALCATHACGQIEIVLARLQELVDGTGDVDKRLAIIVECHLRVLRFAAVLEQVLREVCLVEFAASTFMICLLEYYCITEWEQSNVLGLTTYTMLLMALTFNIFILCYIGELLMEKSGKVGILCMLIEWYRLPVKTSRGLILIIAMSNNPIKISAGRMADLSIFTFGNILKTSVAYLSFLRTAIM